MTREEMLEAARKLVGSRGEVRDYPCNCEPGGERFIVKWQSVAPATPPTCYNYDELLEESAGYLSAS